MVLTFVETTGFTAAVHEYFVSDERYASFQEDLLANPERGDVMPGCGGLRKTRWPDARRRKGSRGGLRVIYLYVPDLRRILLLDIYDKDEATDLAPEQSRRLAALADAYRAEAREGGRSIRKGR